MKSDRILSALGAADEALLDKCESFIPVRHSPWKWAATAAGLALAILASAAILHNKPLSKTEPDDTTQTASIAEVQGEGIQETGYYTEQGTDASEQTQPAIHLPMQTVPDLKTAAADTTSKGSSGTYSGYKMGSADAAQETAPAVSTTVRPLTEEEKALFNKAPTYATKYPTLILDGKHYTSRGRSYPVVPEIAQENPETVTLTGFDGTHKTTGIVKPIHGISRSAAVAVYFPESENKEIYAYVNTDYKPSTLGTMMKDLNMPEMISFPGVGHNGAQSFSVIEKTEFAKLFKADAPLDSKNHEADVALFLKGIYPEIGYDSSNMFGVTKDGYLVVHLLENEYAFFVGKDRTQAFLNYVDKFCAHGKILAETTKHPMQEGIVVVQTSTAYTPTTAKEP